MHSRKKGLCFLLLQLFFLQSWSQVVTSVRHYSTADGLSDNRVTDITKDSEGFMWFGSWAGITRFDGYNFLTFKSYPGDRSSLKSNRIDEVIEDSGHGHLWLRAYDKQVYRFDKRLQQFSALSDLLQEPALGKLNFSKILTAKNNQVWLKTENQGLVLVSNSAATKPGYTIFSSTSKQPYTLKSNTFDFFFIDKRFNVWIGTSKGLSILKRDRSGKYMAERNSQLSEVFTGISEGANKVWLSTGTGKLRSVDQSTGKVNAYHIGKSSIGHIRVAGNAKVVYCTTQAGELIAVKPEGEIEQLFKEPGSSPLSYIYEDRSGILWIESRGFGIVRFDPKTKDIQYLFPPRNYPINLKAPNFSVFEDREGIVWINLYGNVCFYNKDKKQMQPLSVEGASYNRELPRNIARTFYDPSGVLWLGSGFHGIDKLVFREYDFKQVTFPSEKGGQNATEVRGILADRKNRLWLGIKGGKLEVIENGKSIKSPLLSDPINTAGIYSIFEDNGGKIWMGTKADGLIKAVPSGEKYAISQYFANEAIPNSISSNSIYCLLQDRKGRLWAGSYEEGLILIEEKNNVTSFKTRFNYFKNYPKGGFLKIRHLAEDADGRIWIGTTAGLLVFNPDSGNPSDYKFRQYKKEPGDIQSLGGNDIQFIFRDSRKQMWVLTTTGGLNLAQGKDPLKALSFINYSSRNGLPSDFLLSCTEDSQRNLWIATQNGISKFSIDKRTFQNFNYTDGLQEGSFSEAASARMKTGEVVFGNTLGYVSFDPATIQVRKSTAPLVFTNFQINSQDIVPADNSPLKVSINNSDKIELEYDQNVISIDFAVLDFHSVDKQNFAYRLLGFDNVWRNSEGQRRATFTKLPPGNYVFEVKSLNEELYKKLPFRSLQIIVLPPLWKTWWAYAIYLIIALIGLIMARRLAITMFKLRQGIEVERKLSDLKLNFFTQISHELRTPLTLIINPSEEVLKHEGLSGKGKEYMSVVVKNARRMLRMVNQVLDLRKVQSGKAVLQLSEVDMIVFVQGILDYFREAVADKSLSVELIAENKDLLVYVDQDKLEIVIYNLLANAIKFSPDGGVIRVQVSINELSKTVSLEVADEGPGVKEDELQAIFKLYYEGAHQSEKHVKGTGIGLALSKELVELHGGKIYAEHNKPQGLKVLVDIPANFKAAHLPQLEGIEIGQASIEVLRGTGEYSEAELSIAGDEELKPVVLIVEDNDDLRAFLASKFSAIYRIETACDGEEGLEKASALLPDLVLSDIMMPRMNGIQLLDQLKTNSTTSHIPVVLLTAKYSVESQIDSLKYGADYYITKPFQMELLETAISSIIKQRKKLFHALVNKDEEVLAEPEVISITAYDKAFLEKIIQVVESKLHDSDFNIEDVAESVDMSRSAFYKKFKSLTNIAPVEFVRELRLKKAKELFDAGEDNVSVAAYAVGFNNPKYFSTCFKAQYQKTPTEYLKGIRKPGKAVTD